MSTTINRAYGIAGMLQAMPMRISTPQWQELQDVERIAKHYGWHTHQLPGEYGTVRLICEKQDRILKVSAVPPMVLREGRKLTRNRLFFHYGHTGEKLKPLPPRDAATQLAKKRGEKDHDEIR